MRKYILYIGFLLPSFASCQEKEIIGYSLERDGLQFNYDTNALRVTVDFMKEYVTDTMWWGQPGNSPYDLIPKYSGDSLVKKGVKLNLYLMGRAADYDREFRLKAKVEEGEDPTAVSFLEFEPSYVFRAGQLKDTVEVYVLNPKVRKEFTVSIVFDVENSDPSLELGAAEKDEYRVRLINRYPQPREWDDNVVGEYTEDKYAFMVTILKTLYNPYANWSEDLKTLNEALAEYKALHPDEEVDFSFPEPPAPQWWNYPPHLAILGEYSMAKHTFMQEVLSAADYESFVYWYAEWDAVRLNQLLRNAYDQYNTEHPDNPLPFEQFPVL